MQISGTFYFIFIIIIIITSRYPISERARLLMLQEERSLHLYRRTASLMDPKTELHSLFTSKCHLNICVTCVTSVFAYDDIVGAS